MHHFLLCLRVALVFVAAVGLLHPVRPALADETSETILVTRTAQAGKTWAVPIDVAGRQRMLSQKMTSAVCLAMLDISRKHYARVADEVAREFETQLENLRQLPPLQGRSSQSVREVVAKLDTVAAHSGGLTRSVRQIAAGDMHSLAVGLVLARNGPVLKSMDATVQVMVSHTGTTLPKRTAQTLNQAGRQRMLSQKIVKDICLIAVGLKTTQSRRSLKHDLTYFRSVHEAFMGRGANSHFDSPPTAQIVSELQRVDIHWRELEPIAISVVEGAEVTLDMVRDVARLGDSILRHMDRAVVLWAREHS